MFDLAHMSLDDWSDCSRRLWGIGEGASSMEEVAGRIVRYLCDSFSVADSDRDGGMRRSPFALARVYKTHIYRSLPVELMDFVDEALGAPPSSLFLKCLTLIGTAGDEPNWNDRRRSAGHQAVPLVSEEMVRSRIPMVARLIEQFGVDARAVLSPDPSLLVGWEGRQQGVFFVPAASGSDFIPAQQDFVAPYHIRSVVGFGGILPSGDLFAVILFSRLALSQETAEAFGSLALPVKIALLPFTFGPIFAA